MVEREKGKVIQRCGYFAFFGQVVWVEVRREGRDEDVRDKGQKGKWAQRKGRGEGL